MIYNEENLDFTKEGTIIFIDEDKELIKKANQLG